jgi:hypothetical protein
MADGAGHRIFRIWLQFCAVCVRAFSARGFQSRTGTDDQQSIKGRHDSRTVVPIRCYLRLQAMRLISHALSSFSNHPTGRVPILMR